MMCFVFVAGFLVQKRLMRDYQPLQKGTSTFIVQCLVYQQPFMHVPI